MSGFQAASHDVVYAVLADPYALAALGDPVASLYDGSGKWTALVTSKVIADLGRKGSQNNQASFASRSRPRAMRIRPTT